MSSIIQVIFHLVQQFLKAIPSAQETEILTSAANSIVRNIVVFSVDGEVRWVRSGEKDLPPDNDAKLSAEYMDALHSLQNKGLVRQVTTACGSSLESYEITGKGYKIIERNKVNRQVL